MTRDPGRPRVLGRAVATAVLAIVAAVTFVTLAAQTSGVESALTERRAMLRELAELGRSADLIDDLDPEQHDREWASLRARVDRLALRWVANPPVAGLEPVLTETGVVTLAEVGS